MPTAISLGMRATARERTLYMFDTLAVFHLEMSALNVGDAVDEG